MGTVRKKAYDDEELVATALPVDPRPLLPPVVTASGTEHNAYGWFTALKSELQLQIVRETYDTWLRTAELVDHVPASDDTPATLTIRLHNVYAKAWIEHRLDKVIRRQVARMLGKAVRLVYVGPEEAEPNHEEVSPWWERARPDMARTDTKRSAS